MTEALAPVIQSLELQAGVCAQMGSPFSASVARAVAADIAAGGAFAELAAPWGGKDVRAMFNNATSLRFLGGLHFLVLNGQAPELAEVYPPVAAEVDPSRLTELVAAAGRGHRDFFKDFLTSPPQTNEVNRSVCSAGFMVVARRAGLPLRCLEIGASAGLNLNWDRYHYSAGEAAWGDPASPVRLGAEWTGVPPPLEAQARVAERRGCDQNPIDVSDTAQALRLKAYVWPDQQVRLERLAAAIVVAQRHRPPVEKADAAEWAQTHARTAPGTATVLYHSIVWSYLPDQTQDGVRAAIEAAGESASAEAPFAWLRMEPNPHDLASPTELRLTYWPSGEEFLLGRVHPHGASVAWNGD